MDFSKLSRFTSSENEFYIFLHNKKFKELIIIILKQAKLLHSQVVSYRAKQLVILSQSSLR